MIHLNGSIAYGEAKTIDEAEHQIIAKGIDDFFCNVMMGNRYQQVFKSDEIDEDSWLDYLVSQGWV